MELETGGPPGTNTQYSSLNDQQHDLWSSEVYALGQFGNEIRAVK